MKANRKFKEEEAVSAVIGVILMVAITVAIAATVYVYVSGMLGGVDTKTPDLDFNKEIIPTSGLRVVRIDANILWVDFSITGGIAPETGNVAYIDVGEFVKLTSGQTIITISYKPTNTLLGYWNW